MTRTGHDYHIDSLMFDGKDKVLRLACVAPDGRQVSVVFRGCEGCDLLDLNGGNIILEIQDFAAEDLPEDIRAMVARRTWFGRKTKASNVYLLSPSYGLEALILATSVDVEVMA